MPPMLAGRRFLTSTRAELVDRRSDASNSSTLSVTSHETSNPEVFTFDNVNDSLILEWDASNAFWWTVKNLGVAT